jgi:hypothetical protein
LIFKWFKVFLRFPREKLQQEVFMVLLVLL